MRVSDIRKLVECLDQINEVAEDLEYIEYLEHLVESLRNIETVNDPVQIAKEAADAIELFLEKERA